MKRLDNKSFLTRLLSNFSDTKLSVEHQRLFVTIHLSTLFRTSESFPLSHGQLLSLRPQNRRKCNEIKIFFI